jgi:4-hydroxy-3-polyprenylbenzoate decarboxylase
MSKPIVVGVTGGSGAPYAVRLLEVLLAGGHEVHLIVSPSGAEVLRQELALEIDPFQLAAAQWGSSIAAYSEQLKVHAPGDFFAPVASGSFLTTGMVICPCSGTTLSGVVHGTASNLIQRAAEVHLKERRRLVLVPRETPVSLVHVENLRKACLAGAVVLPASPGWYHGVRDLQDLVDFIVARILDQLEIPHQLMRRWGAESGGAV